MRKEHAPELIVPVRTCFNPIPLIPKCKQKNSITQVDITILFFVIIIITIIVIVVVVVSSF